MIIIWTKKNIVNYLTLEVMLESLIFKTVLWLLLYLLYNLCRPKDRQDVLNRVYKGLNTGGAFIFSEKTFSCNPRVQDMMTFMYYDYKRQNFSDKDILDKVQLRHMMKPNTKTELYKMVQDAGFEIHTFWQNFNFVGVIGLKK